MAFIPARHGTKNTGRRAENNNGVSRLLDEAEKWCPATRPKHADAIESIIQENGISGCSPRLVKRYELPSREVPRRVILVTERKNVTRFVCSFFYG